MADNLKRGENTPYSQVMSGYAMLTRPTADFVVVGKDPGSKFDDTKRLGVPILNETAFRKLLGRSE